MQFNPFVLAKGEMMWEHYTYFTRKAAFHSPQSKTDIGFTISIEEWNEVLRFIVLFIDNQSPYAYEKDFDIRKKLAFEALDLQGKTNIIHFINDANVFFRKALFEYFKDIKDHDYRLWYTKLFSIFKYQNFLMFESDSETDIEKRMKIELEVNKNLTHLTDEIKKLEVKLFGDTENGDFSKRIKDVIQEEATEEELSGYPERYAKQIEY